MLLASAIEVGEFHNFGGTVHYNNDSIVTETCCNASIWFPNHTNFITNGTMDVSAFGFHNYSVTPNTTGDWVAVMECNCSSEYDFENLDFIVVNSSLTPLNQNATVTLNSLEAEIQCYIAGHAPELQGNIALDADSTLTNFLVLAFLLLGGIVFVAIGVTTDKPIYTAIGGLLIAFAGFWVLVNGVNFVSQHNRTYECNYGVNATTGETYLVNATLTNTPTYTSAADNNAFLNGIGMILSIFGILTFVNSARLITNRRRLEKEAKEENEGYGD